MLRPDPHMLRLIAAHNDLIATSQPEIARQQAAEARRERWAGLHPGTPCRLTQEQLSRVWGPKRVERGSRVEWHNQEPPPADSPCVIWHVDIDHDVATVMVWIEHETFPHSVALSEVPRDGILPVPLPVVVEDLPCDTAETPESPASDDRSNDHRPWDVRQQRRRRRGTY